MKAVIFDLDGTLIDTEKYYRICWPKALAHFGYEMSDKQALEIRSMGRPHCYDYFKKNFGEDYDYDKVRDYRKKLMADILEENGIELKPGAKEILGFLKEKGIIRAMATANKRARTERYLEKIGLLEDFDNIVCADMVKRGKPFPDIYSYACEAIGIAPQDCYAVEDSPNGVESAFRAGCKVIFVPDQSPLDDEISGMVTHCFESLMGIKGLF